MTTTVFFEVTALDADLTMRVLSALTKGFKAEFKKRKVVIGTPKESGTVLKTTIVVAPFSVETKV